ncbi:MAG: hypothetical protein WCJ70_00065 [bacterium]
MIRISTLVTICAIIILSLPLWTRAQSPSVAPSTELASTSALLASPSAEIKTLRDKIASHVAQLRKKDQQAVAGQIIEDTEKRYVIESLFGRKETIDLDETLTKYYRFTSTIQEEVTKKEIIPGSYIVVVGPRTDTTISANEIYKDEIYQQKAGRVVEINTATSTLKIDTFEKDSITVAVDSSTIIQQLLPVTHAASAGSLSKIKEGDTVHVVYKLKSITEKFDKVTATRLLHIPATYFAK